ncbi:MAG: DeoR/GlpR transcriptional regulator [Clostridia bacterium]|nr:DeoR/GlpR transcriptional regulator [Clostridia bacterium]
MFAVERQKKIIEQLNSQGSVWVNQLSAELGVTEETIRRDLEKLEKQELLLRTHGGAIPIDTNSYELSLETRKKTNVSSKEAMAKIAIGQIASGDTIFLDASTTTFYMARELKNMNNITVITNSIRVINELAGAKNIKVIATGGMASSNQSYVGSIAENTVAENYFAAKMFFSSKGITIDGWILESNEQECAIKQKMIENSSQKYYLCDKSKIGRIGFVKLASIDKIDCFITDCTPEDEWLKKFEESEVKILNK